MEAEKLCDALCLDGHSLQICVWKDVFTADEDMCQSGDFVLHRDDLVTPEKRKRVARSLLKFLNQYRSEGNKLHSCQCGDVTKKKPRAGTRITLSGDKLMKVPLISTNNKKKS